VRRCDQRARVSEPRGPVRDAKNTAIQRMGSGPRVIAVAMAITTPTMWSPTMGHIAARWPMRSTIRAVGTV
jgi:hypothetical protein